MMAEVYGSYESANTFFLPEIGHIYQEGDLIRFSGLVYKRKGEINLNITHAIPNFTDKQFLCIRNT